MELLVSLGDVAVGTIRSRRDGRNEFAFSNDYLQASPRPVLGQYFEDHLTEVFRGQTRLPPFFSNLLPEGGLRELVARRAGLHPDREVEIISVLGDDLPGAVVVRPVSTLDLDEMASAVGADEPQAHDRALRFSLAGAQLKFSVLYRAGGRGPTLSVHGTGGNWIAKLPSETYQEVPEHEFAMIQWARRAGIAVPEVALVRVGDIEGLPIKLPPDRMVFLSRRFDRAESGVRVHQEDFAQVRNVRPTDGYGTLGYGSIARIVRSVAGEDDFDEVIRRIAFNVLIGNGDAHLKNWSLVYPDSIRARLSPAYDLVATVTYIPTDALALKLSRESRFDAIRISHFERLAAQAAVPPERVTRLVRETIGRALASRPGRGELGAERAALLEAQVDRLPLVAEAG